MGGGGWTKKASDVVEVSLNQISYTVNKQLQVDEETSKKNSYDVPSRIVS